MPEERMDGEERVTASARRSRPKPTRHSDMTAERDSRIMADREGQEREVVEEREITDDERLEMFRDSLQQSVLPDIPKIDGYHVCWLSTTNGRDSIARRRQIGYELIRAEDLPHWDGASLSAGDNAGVICVNEMVAAKIPLRLYNRMMKLVHDDLPREEADKLKAKVELLKQQAREVGSMIEVGDGMAEELNSRARSMPVMTE